MVGRAIPRPIGNSASAIMAELRAAVADIRRKERHSSELLFDFPILVFI